MSLTTTVWISLWEMIRNALFDFLFEPYHFGRSTVVKKVNRYNPPPPNMLGGGGLGTGYYSQHLILALKEGNGEAEIKVSRGFYNEVQEGDSLIVKCRVGCFTNRVQAKPA